jgi:glutaminyl-peptide cyclotransferase
MPQGYAPLYAVLWDMIGDYTQEFRQEANSVQRAPEVVERVWNTARDLGLGRVFLDRGRDGITDDHIPLQEAGLRIVDVIDCCNDGYAYWHTTQDTPDKVSPQSLSNAGRVAMALLR